MACMVVLVFNDHVAKDRWPSVVTGKLSDFAGLAFFPLLLVSLAEALRWAFRREAWQLGRVAVLIACLATGVAFSAIKLWEPAGDAFRLANGVARWPVDAVVSLLGGEGLPALRPVRLVADPTDLVALPALWFSVWVAGRTERRRAAIGRAFAGRAGARGQA